MKLPLSRLLFAVSLCLFTIIAAGQTKNPPGFLWRISGPKLSKSSYLYGTIHVADRRMFYFGDSLYNSLEKTDGYAMEIDPDSAFIHIYQGTASKESATAAGGASKKQRWLDSYKGGLEKKEDDMEAAMDTYLYNIAKRQGKWVGGIEDIQDQLSALEGLGIGGDANGVPYAADYKKKLEQLAAIYQEQDLDKLEAWALATDSLSRDHILYRRNPKMVQRIDSIMALRSCFFAVGAAHLPGEKGLLALLRARGYTVTPVLSSHKIAPEAYTYKAIDLPWKTWRDAPGSFTIQMPGRPIVFALPDGPADGNLLQMYQDFGTGIVYYMKVLRYPSFSGNADSLVLSEAGRTAGNKKVLAQENVACDGVLGVELRTDNTDNYFYRIRVFMKGENLFMAMTSSRKKAAMGNADNERFFNSLVMTSALHAPVAKAWIDFTLPDKGFSVTMPFKPLRNTQMEQQFRKGKFGQFSNFTCYNYIDSSAGSEYAIIIKDVLPGHHPSSDTADFHDARQSLINSGAKASRFDIGMSQGYPALNMEVLSDKSARWIYGFALCKGARSYELLAITPKDNGDSAAARQFLRSFRLLNNQGK